MKTSNKLILAGMIVVLAVVLAWLIFMRTQISSYENRVSTRSSQMSLSQGVAVKHFDLKDFDSIHVSGSWKIDVRKGDQYGVQINMPRDLIDRLIVQKKGDVLFLGLKNNVRLRDDDLTASIVMPSLRLIDASGASRIRFSGFHIPSLRIRASGASRLVGAGNNIQNFSIKGSGSTHLDLKKSQLFQAKVDFSGASRAYLNFKNDGVLAGQISGASFISYSGDLKSQAIQASGTSIVRKKIGV